MSDIRVVGVGSALLDILVQLERMPRWEDPGSLLELEIDGGGLVGERVSLLRNRLPWEGHVIEAPTMWREGRDYYLFYSGNAYDRLEYAIGYARCESAMGPCVPAEENPIVAGRLGDQPVIGPGHQTIVRGPDGQLWLAYHAWEVTPEGTRGSVRNMWLDRLESEDGRPVVHGPTVGAQAMP